MSIFVMLACRYLVFVSVIAFNKSTLRQEAIKSQSKVNLFVSHTDFKRSSTHQIWKDNYHEVEINKVMYEIASIKAYKGGYMLQLAKDVKETSWLNIFSKLNLKKNILKDLLNLFNQLHFYDQDLKKDLHFFLNEISNGILTKTQLYLHSFISELIKPPCL